MVDVEADDLAMGIEVDVEAFCHPQVPMHGFYFNSM
jgi:hypothetical protein